jgi:hypothetical protein
VSVRVEQADFDELLGILIADYSLSDGVDARNIEVQSQLRILLALLEEERSARAKRRIERHRVISKLKELLSKDPEHTPLPTRTSTPPLATRSKNSRPPPRNRPPPLPPRSRKP